MGSLTLILILVLLNAFFVSSEIALVSARKTKLDELAKRKNSYTKFVKNIDENLNVFITATQFGSTFTSIAVGWLSQSIFSLYYYKTLGSYIKKMPFLGGSFFTEVIPFILITFFIMTMGELLPKKITMINPEKFALIFMIPLTLFSKVFSPVISFFNYITDFFLNLFGRRANPKQIPFSESELKIIINQSVKDGAIPKSLRVIIFNTLRLKKIKCDDIMVDLSRMKTFATTDSLEEIQQKIAKNNYIFVRYPVVQEKTGKFIGFIESTDFIKALDKFEKKTKLEKTTIIRQAITIPHEKTVDEVFHEMLTRKTHIAVVNGKNNTPQGVITIGDIASLLTK